MQLLTGLQLDELIARHTDGRQQVALTDALGSVLALTDDTQQVTGSWAYAPYGETVAIGPGIAQPLQYTGREHDEGASAERGSAQQVYYYRARYYAPGMKRFVSEDPIGIAGGINVYGYVGGDPISHADPLGLWSVTIEAYGGVGGGVTFGRDPNTGQPFMTMRAGWGGGGGIKWDKSGGRPGSDGLTNVCGGNSAGAGVGVFGDVDFNAGPLQAGLQNSLGASAGTGSYGQFMSPAWAVGNSWGIKAGVSFGAQFTVWTPDVRGRQ